MASDNAKTGAAATPATVDTRAKTQQHLQPLISTMLISLPLVVTPINGRGNCSIAGCDDDLRTTCPPELALKNNGKTIACRSACDVFNTSEYCCRGFYGNHTLCQPTNYSKKFKEACPATFCYAYDDPAGIFNCSGADYVITFCASRKQTLCTYHNNSHICSGSKGLRSLIGTRWAVMLAMLLTIKIMR